jgi:hypothetical protein
VSPPAATLALIALAVAISACGNDASPLDPAAQVIRLPGAAREIDFDDIVYSRQLGRIVVPARRSGVYLVDPRSGAAKRLGRPADADSADAGDGLIFVVNRDRGGSPRSTRGAGQRCSRSEPTARLTMSATSPPRTSSG